MVRTTALLSDKHAQLVSNTFLASPKKENCALGSCYLEPEIGAREQLVLSAHVFKHIIVLCRLHEASKQDIVQLTGVKRHVRAKLQYKAEMLTNAEYITNKCKLQLHVIGI